MKTKKVAQKKAEKKTEKKAVKAAAKNTACEKKPIGRKPGRPAGKTVIFTVRAEAGQDVRLAGSFTDWETKAKKMKFVKKDGFYTAVVKLAPGEYQYKFIIGDQWTTDEQNMNQVPNDMGSFNSVVDVK